MYQCDRARHTRVVCYLTGVIIAILVLIAVIVVLTLMVANREMARQMELWE